MPRSENIEEVLNKSEEIHGRLWSQAKSLVKEDMDSELRSLFVASLNELIDLHQSRQTVGLQYRIPGSVWLSVYLLSALSMLALGYQVGMSGTRRLMGHAGAGGGVLAGDHDDRRHRPSRRGFHPREPATDRRRAADDAARFAVSIIPQWCSFKPQEKCSSRPLLEPFAQGGSQGVGRLAGG